MANGLKPAWELEQDARAVNATDWQTMSGMVKRQCDWCRYFFAGGQLRAALPGLRPVRHTTTRQIGQHRGGDDATITFYGRSRFRNKHADLHPATRRCTWLQSRRTPCLGPADGHGHAANRMNLRMFGGAACDRKRATGSPWPK